MGKQRVNIFIFLTAIFVSFILGFFVGKNHNPSPVQISRLAAVEEDVPTTKAPPAVYETSYPLDTEPATEAETVTATENTTSQTEAHTAAESATKPEVAQAPKETLTETSVTEAAKEPETTEAAKTTESASASSGLININTATAAQLETLPGIGEVLAQRIVDYRNTYGPFKSVYALTNVKGIGEKRLAAVIHLITV